MDWYNRTGYTDYRNHYRGDDRPVDPDQYRGAYRLDTDSDHRNESTWNWSNRSQRDNTDYNRNYNRDYNQDYNQDYNRNYNQGNRRAGQLANRRDYERDWSGYYHNDRGGFDRDDDNRDRRYPDQDRSGNNRNWDEQYRPTSGGYGTSFGGGSSVGSVRSRIDARDASRSSNFNNDYGPDNYRAGQGENYGNMAGSLSFGYDGTSNYDPDYNRHYDPMSGKRRSYHGNYTSRHPSDQNREDRY